MLYRPVLLEVPHFASLRGREREVNILRSDDGRTWKEHPIVTTDDAVQKCLSVSFEGEGDYSGLVHGCTAFFPSQFSVCPSNVVVLILLCLNVVYSMIL